MLPIIAEPQLRAAISPADAVNVIREAFRADGNGRTAVPSVINLAIPGTEGEFHVKTAWVAGMPYVAVKVASGFYDNPRRGLPTGTGLMMLFDAATGFPVALLLDNGYLTDVRTGAAGAVAAEVLARDNLGTIGVIGSGVQARQQVLCLAEVRKFGRLVAWSIDEPGLRAYVQEIGDRLDIEAVAAEGPEEVVRASDLVITVTPSRAAIVRASWLHPGLHITAVGSDGPGKQELEAGVLGAADLVVVDRLSQCRRLGELQHALASGVLDEQRVHGELGEVVAGLKPGRTSADQVTVVDLTGVGFQDTAIACKAWERTGAAAA